MLNKEFPKSIHNNPQNQHFLQIGSHCRFLDYRKYKQSNCSGYFQFCGLKCIDFRDLFFKLLQTSPMCNGVKLTDFTVLCSKQNHFLLFKNKLKKLCRASVVIIHPLNLKDHNTFVVNLCGIQTMTVTPHKKVLYVVATGRFCHLHSDTFEHSVQRIYRLAFYRIYSKYIL